MTNFGTAYGATIKSALVAAKMTETATIDGDDYQVGFARPGELILDGTVRATDFMMELLDPADVPDLAEGDTVVINGTTYKVREKPYTPEGGDGYYRVAKLSPT